MEIDLYLFGCVCTVLFVWVLSTMKGMLTPPENEYSFWEEKAKEAELWN